MPSAADTNLRWLEALSPWPEEFGLERIHRLLAELGDPQRGYPAIHVVGTNGKTTTARRIEAILLGEGLSVGTFTSPHVRVWAERIRIDGEEADLEVALGRVRAAAEEVGATQFEILTAAALAEFAAGEVDVAVVEAGLGGRLDATNAGLDTRVVVLTNVALEHTQWLGETREEIAAEKLAVIRPGCAVVLGEAEWAQRAGELGGEVVPLPAGPPERTVPEAAAAAFLGRPAALVEDVRVPGRMEWHGENELWDGSHNPAGVDWLLARLPDDRPWRVLLSIVGDKDVDAMLERLASVARAAVLTTSSSGRALPADELGRRARRYFAAVTVRSDPRAALEVARASLEEGERLLVTGSLYLLADLVHGQESKLR